MYKRFAAAALAVSITSAAMAEDKKSAAFLAASPEGQISYITTSLSMAQALLSPSQGECIGKWAATARPAGYKDVVDAIKKYPDYHPSSVVAAVIEKHCGSFQLANR